ncbi:MAG: antitoxin [Bacteroidetes bacterium]|nr:MAG: antitoxin [Bacteroidota bacterium]RLD79179.1 MAG: antitoxin [Bacteroidota bacterium]
MDNEILTWLFDIDLAITEIDSFFEEENKKYANYQKDLKTKRAVERNLEIIGEAVKRILSSGKNIKLTNARKIVDTRNRIIHGYDTISDDVIWGIIINHLPQLKIEVNELMKK